MARLSQGYSENSLLLEGWGDTINMWAGWIEVLAKSPDYSDILEMCRQYRRLDHDQVIALSEAVDEYLTEHNLHH